MATKRMTMMSGALCTDLIDEFSVFDLFTESKKHPTDVTNGTHYLRGFDPMLEISESRDDQGPWPDGAVDLDISIASSDSTHESHYAPMRSCSNELRDIAAELARVKPRALTKDEENQITLGNSVKESGVKKERNLLTKASNKARSLSRASPPATSERREGEKPNEVAPSTPLPKDRRKLFRRALSSKLSPRPKNKKSPISSLTRSLERDQSSPRNTPSRSPKLVKKLKVSKLSPMRRKTNALSIDDLAIPTLAKPNPTSFLKDASAMALKTSEQDPSPHQVEIPTSQELLVHSKLCALMDSYEKIGKDFDFNNFKGMDLQVLSKAASDETQSVQGMTPVHKTIIKELLKCAIDIHVEGFFTHGQDKAKSRVAIFSIQSSSRIIVVYRGTTEQQLRPARAKGFAVDLDPNNAVSIYKPARDAYFHLETPVYELLDKLMEDNPFSHMIFVGHSFGGALATIGAVRFASARPMQCFSCHTFGSPKVGAHDFRNMANSLPNLKIMRVEYGSDPNAGNPFDMGPLKWEHVGHTIAIHGSVGTSTKLPASPVMAYRFDKKKPSSSLLQTRKNTVQDYVGAIELFATNQLQWVALFAGEDGEGVRGKDNEARSMV